MESAMQVRLFFLLAAMLPIFAFAGKSARLPLPNELKGEAIPHFFVLAANNVDALHKKDIKEAADKAKAKRVVISFFAHWCVKCKEEFALLKKNKDELKKRGVLVYLINVGDDIHELGGKVKKMVNESAGDSFPYYFDPDADLPLSFGLAKQGETMNLPVTLILDSNLKVLGILAGEAGEDFPQVLWSEL